MKIYLVYGSNPEISPSIKKVKHKNILFCYTDKEGLSQYFNSRKIIKRKKNENKSKKNKKNIRQSKFTRRNK